MSSVHDVLCDVRDERSRQDQKWGRQDHPDGTGVGMLAELGAELEAAARHALSESPTYAAILAEEVGEALQESNPTRLREELVQVAAVAVAWVQLIDRRRGVE